jgi:hypothetical protein
MDQSQHYQIELPKITGTVDVCAGVITSPSAAL